MQGSGTFGIEAVISSVIPPCGKLLVIVNGAYGKRIVSMAKIHQMEFIVQQYPENEIPDLDLLEKTLQNDGAISHVAVVHCETTTGIINPIEEIGAVVKRNKRKLIVDAMSSFGAYPISVEPVGIDFLISSSNKCIEGVPGFSFVIARNEQISAT